MSSMVYGENGDKVIYKLSEWLKKQDSDEIIIRTTFVKGGWHDVEFDANRAGYRISRGFYDVWQKRNEFSDCYILTRKND